MGSMESLYQDTILKHHRNPVGQGPLTGATHRAKGVNPVCGDEIEILLEVEAGRVKAARFQGQGCAISRASASLLCDYITGRSTEQALAVARSVQADFRDRDRSFTFDGEEELEAIGGVRQYPARARCATLAWEALEAAIGSPAM